LKQLDGPAEMGNYVMEMTTKRVKIKALLLVVNALIQINRILNLYQCMQLQKAILIKVNVKKKGIIRIQSNRFEKVFTVYLYCLLSSL